MANWREECNRLILEAIPRGYSLDSAKQQKTTVVRHFAVLAVYR